MIYLNIAAEDVRIGDQLYIDDLAKNKQMCWADVKKARKRKVGKDEFRIVISAGGRSLVCRPGDLVLIQRFEL